MAKKNSTKPTEQTGTKAAPVDESTEVAPVDDLPDDGALDEVDPGDESLQPDPPDSQPPVVDKARRGNVVAEKAVADGARRTAVIEEHQENAPEPDPALVASDEARADLMEALHELDASAKELETSLDEIRQSQGELLLTLYPQQGPNDPHYKAVRGFLKASAAQRRHRAIGPERLKSMLKLAGMSPVDASMQRARFRGANRPKHPQRNAGAAPAPDPNASAKPEGKE